MNSCRAPLVWLILTGVSAVAQDPTRSPALPADLVSLSPSVGPRRTAAELEQLLAPIALYPDALIALILPASTAPADVVLAARQVREAGNDRSQIEHRAWDESVKSLTYYPDILKWMDENLEWTKQVGEAFAEQPVEVMQAVQRLRARARAAGTLVDTPQQQVLSELEIIRIVPAQPNAIYVPYYDPGYMFLDAPGAYTRPFMTFGFGLPVGSWLAFECDWRRHTIWMGNRHRRWSGHDWHRPLIPLPIVAPTYAQPHEVRPWRPPAPPFRRPLPPSNYASVEVSRSAPVNPPVARIVAPTPPIPRPGGAPTHPRRGPPPATSVNPGQPSSMPLSTATVVTAPFGTVPAGTVATKSETTTPAVSSRRGAPERVRNQEAPGHTYQRQADATSGSSPRPAQTATSAPPVADQRAAQTHSVSHSRPAPSSGGAASQSSSPPPARSHPAVTASPAAPPAAAPPPPRTEKEPDRSTSRRSPNEP